MDDLTTRRETVPLSRAASELNTAIASVEASIGILQAGGFTELADGLGRTMMILELDRSIIRGARTLAVTCPNSYHLDHLRKHGACATCGSEA